MRQRRVECLSQNEQGFESGNRLSAFDERDGVGMDVCANSESDLCQLFSFATAAYLVAERFDE
ncbi:hypothetical protein WI61_07315 [Burkholderia cepacia]|nr:hypothetical protein WI48_01780 [Burkholderia cepacia]KVA70810.1 hypothetical protein WI49_35525 [Burkholderia cepacia]KVA77511.1 hypothetical protein WI52_27110 [Burkholderia cepacia]KVA82345.1 hypothetical protein WI51_24885 [Burkholderia cepacia]KVA84234.1 hypothetical protein WI50_18805 [Burkholderia cepacia]